MTFLLLLFADVLKSVNPFIDRIPIQDQQDYIQELINDFVDAGFQLNEPFEDNETLKIAPPYKLLVAYARK